MNKDEITRPVRVVPTKLGNVEVDFNDRNRLSVQIGSNNYTADRNLESFVIRGVAHRGRVHMQIDEAGNLRVGNSGNKGSDFYQNMFVKQVSIIDASYTGKDATYAAKDKIAETLIDALTVFLKQPENAQILLDAYAYARKNEIDSEVREIEKLQAQITERQKKITEIESGLDPVTRERLDKHYTQGTNDDIAEITAELAELYEEMTQPAELPTK